MKLSVSLLLFCLVSCQASKSLIPITEENWRQILQSEWMIEFYAPWCPACKDLSKAWGAFADWSKDLDVKVAAVDVTANPGLSGRFLVTALPTIYHVKDGVFRHYTGSRDKEDFISFIEEKKWAIIEPVAQWKHPDTMQMSVVAKFFKMSMAVRDAHTHLVEKKGIPAWGSYMIFGGATLVLGCFLGFLIVCLIDCFFPANGAPAKPTPTKTAQKAKENKKDKQIPAQQKKEKKERESDHDEKPESQASQSEGSGDEQEVRQRKKENGKVANGKAVSAQASPGKKK